METHEKIKAGSRVICEVRNIGLKVGKEYTVQRMGCCNAGITVYIDGNQFLKDWFVLSSK